MTQKWSVILLGVLAFATPAAGEEQVPSHLRPLIVGHRGLLKHSPENTLSNFRACLELRIGFELDIRRSKDGVLVCVHDDSVNRTTDGRGAVDSQTLSELKQLDAGAWFSPSFRGERIPTFDEMLAALEKSRHQPVLIAVDLKAADVEADCVHTAKKHGVLDRLLFIGKTIDDPMVRRTLRRADSSAHVACLAQSSQDLRAAIADDNSDWTYLRFVPTETEIRLVHSSGKRAFIAGPTVAGLERENWQSASMAGIDAILTDYPLELAQQLLHKSEAAK